MSGIRCGVEPLVSITARYGDHGEVSNRLRIVFDHVKVTFTEEWSRQGLSSARIVRERRPTLVPGISLIRSEMHYSTKIRANHG